MLNARVIIDNAHCFLIVVHASGKPFYFPDMAVVPAVSKRNQYKNGKLFENKNKAIDMYDYVCF